MGWRSQLALSLKVRDLLFLTSIAFHIGEEPDVPKEQRAGTHHAKAQVLDPYRLRVDLARPAGRRAPMRTVLPNPQMLAVNM